MDISKERIDAVKSKDGVWYTLDSETSLLIANATSKHYQNVLRGKMRQHLKELRTNTLTDEVQDSLTTETIAECVLLDWKGLKENGEDIVYSPEKALEILNDPALIVLREHIEYFATQLDNFYEEGAENLKK